MPAAKRSKKPSSTIPVRARKKSVMDLAETSTTAPFPNGESMYYSSTTNRTTEVEALVFAGIKNKKLLPLHEEIMYLYRVAKEPHKYPDFKGARPLRPLQGGALNSWVSSKIGLPVIEVKLIVEKAERILAKLEAQAPP